MYIYTDNTFIFSNSPNNLLGEFEKMNVLSVFICVRIKTEFSSYRDLLSNILITVFGQL